MKTLTLNTLKYCDDAQPLSYVFNEGEIYAITTNSPMEDKITSSLFEILSFFKYPKRGYYYWKDLEVKKMSPTLYRKNMILIIDKETKSFKNMSVYSYLKYCTDNFSIFSFENMDFNDSLNVMYNLLNEFKLDAKEKLKNLAIEDKWRLHMVTTLLRDNELLLINKVLDEYDDTLQNICFGILNKNIKKCHQCVIIFTNNENIAKKADHLIVL